ATPVDPESAFAAEAAVARRAEGECSVQLFSDLEEAVQDRGLLGEVERIRLEGRFTACFRVVSIDLERRLHQYRLPSGFHLVITTGLDVIAGAPGRKDATVCESHLASSRAG